MENSDAHKPSNLSDIFKGNSDKVIKLNSPLYMPNNEHFEHLAKIAAYIKKSNESDNIKNQIQKLSTTTLMTIYNKKAGLAGLKNLGNTCYLNAVIQCLRHTMILNNYLFGPKLQAVLMRNQETQSTDNIKIALLINYMTINSSLWDNNNAVLTPLIFKSMFGHIFDQFKGNNQHDAHECLVTILDVFHQVLSRTVKYNITGEVINELDKHVKKAHEDWANHYKKRHSAILDIFSGQLQSKIVCPNCQIISYKYDPFMALDLPLLNPIPPPSPISYTIYECLNNYVEPEQLTLTNLYNCENCKNKSQAFRMHSIWTLPNVLIIKLSRFNYNFSDGNYHMNKIDDFIHYPIIDLDISKYISSPLNDKTKYDLFSIICHRGSANHGHYYSYCLNSLKNKWYEFNDESVTEITNIENLITQNAYILFYQKKS